MKMEGRIRSGGVLKLKNSSGCLVIKKKDEHRHVIGGLAGQDDYSEGRKRPGLKESDWGSEEEYSESMRREVSNNKLHNDSISCDVIEPIDMVSGRNSAGFGRTERKRSRYEPFDLDDCGVDVANSNKTVKYTGSGNPQEFGYAGGNLAAGKWKHDLFHVGSSSASSMGVECHGVKNKEFDSEADEACMPISLSRLKYQESVGKPIRFQGKNGVLKVTVTKKTKMDLRSLHENYNFKENGGKNDFTPEDVHKDALTQLPSFSVPMPPENRSWFVEKEKSFEKKKSEGKSDKVKPVANIDSNAKDLVISGTDTLLKLAPPGMQTCVSNNVVRKDEEKSSSHENVVSVKDNEGKKAKCGGSTEKQVLRVKIRQMLVDAGWTIDYRGRRNRDYLDAVYINPSGTAYWSIIKAYDAFKKKLEENNGKSKSNASFAPLSEELINKLTRKTKKKIELERKKMEEDDMIKKDEKSAPREGSKILDSDKNEKKLGSFRKQKKKSVSSVMGHESKDNLI